MSVKADNFKKTAGPPPIPKMLKPGHVITVDGLYAEIAEIVYNAKFCWQAKARTFSSYRLKLPKKAKVSERINFFYL
jgi:hypothetical protein